MRTVKVTWKTLSQFGCRQHADSDSESNPIERRRIRGSVNDTSSMAEQSSVPHIAGIVLAHRLDERAQSVDQHGILLLRSNSEGPADALEHLREFGLPWGGEAVQLGAWQMATRARSMVATFFSATARAVR
jgi:hypothetical protein